MQDQEEQDVNQKVFDEIPEPTGTDSSSAEAEEQPTDQAAGSEDQQPQEEAAPAKNGANNRIRELSAEKNLSEAENGVKDAQIRSLQEKISEYNNDYSAGLPPTEVRPPVLDPGQEITPAEYQKHVMDAADAMVELKLQKRENISRIKSELVGAITEHPQLNPNSKDNFDPDLSDAITGAVSAFIKANPTGNVTKYINSLMKPYNRSVEKAVGKQQETVAKQVSETALRPTNTPQGGNKPFKELSEKEMEQKLGKVWS